jgi:hypothetical protein
MPKCTASRSLGLLDTGSAPRRNAEGATQPADKSLINRRLKRSIPCSAQLISNHGRRLSPWSASLRPKSLTMDIRVKRLTIDVPLSLRVRIKAQCALPARRWPTKSVYCWRSVSRAVTDGASQAVDCRSLCIDYSGCQKQPSSMRSKG